MCALVCFEWVEWKGCISGDNFLLNEYRAFIKVQLFLSGCLCEREQLWAYSELFYRTQLLQTPAQNDEWSSMIFWAPVPTDTVEQLDFVLKIALRDWDRGDSRFYLFCDKREYFSLKSQ